MEVSNNKRLKLQYLDKKPIENLEIPEILINKVIYGITGWNPMAKKVDAEYNNKKNKELYIMLLKLNPESIFNSKGEDPGLSWMEEGFSVVFNADIKIVDDKMLELGKLFGQAAIYKWIPRNKTEFFQYILPCFEELKNLTNQNIAYIVQ